MVTSKERVEKWVGRVFQGKNAGKKGALAQQVMCVKAISWCRSSRTGEQAGKRLGSCRLQDGKKRGVGAWKQTCNMLAGHKWGRRSQPGNLMEVACQEVGAWQPGARLRRSGE